MPALSLHFLCLKPQRAPSKRRLNARKTLIHYSRLRTPISNAGLVYNASYTVRFIVIADVNCSLNRGSAFYRRIVSKLFAVRMEDQRDRKAKDEIIENHRVSCINLFQGRRRGEACFHSNL